MSAIVITDRRGGPHLLPVDNIAYVTPSKEGTALVALREATVPPGHFETKESYQDVEMLLHFAYMERGIWRLSEQGLVVCAQK